MMSKRLRDACSSRHTNPWDPEWGLDDATAAGLCAALEPCLDAWSQLPLPPPLDGAKQRKALLDWVAETAAQQQQT